MARKMKSVALSESWLEFWPVLFPGTPVLQKTLEEWVWINLVHFDPTTFIDVSSAEATSLAWTNDISVTHDRLGARVSIGDQALGLSPWFATTLIEHSPQWKDRHPIEHLVKRGPPKDATSRQLAIDSAMMTKNVTLRAGNHICSTVKKALLDGRLSATGIQANDSFSARRSVPVDCLRAMTKLDLLNNRIEFPPGITSIVHVEVVRNPDYKADKRKGGSFGESDDKLVEEMHQIITSGQASSIKNAAMMVFARAERRGDSNDDSVVERLCRAYGSRYPTRP